MTLASANIVVFISRRIILNRITFCKRLFSADEGADVGADEGTRVTEDYKERDNKFTGRIRQSGVTDAVTCGL